MTDPVPHQRYRDLRQAVGCALIAVGRQNFNAGNNLCLLSQRVIPPPVAGAEKCKDWDARAGKHVHRARIVSHGKNRVPRKLRELGNAESAGGIDVPLFHERAVQGPL